MRPRSPRGLLALPAALALAGAVALAAGTRPEGTSARVELELLAVLPLPDGHAGLVVLREKGEGRLLPVVVPDRTAFEAGALRGEGSLAARALQAVGAEVRAVELEAASETSEGALVRLSDGRRELAVPGRPSDVLALALAAGVPILVRRRLLDDEGLAAEELDAARREAQVGDPVRL